MSKKVRVGKIMPRQRGTGPLDLVIAIMAFLAALALGASLIADRTAESWRAGLSGKLTVQILPPDKADSRDRLKEQTDAALAILRATPGIAFAKPLSEQEELQLLKPWIGDAQAIEDLPLPQLIDADIIPGQSIDTQNLTKRLRDAVPGAHLDDHSHWMQRLHDFAGSIVWSAYGILFLIAIATSAVVAFATRAGLESHRDMVALLHQMGARGNFIARIFEWHYARAAFFASALGMVLSAGLFFAAAWLQTSGIQAVLEAVPFLPPLVLQNTEYLWLLIIPAASGLIGLMTARLSVWAFLSRIY